MVPRMRLLLVDNYDSFTHNLAQLLAEVTGAWPVVVPNDTPLLALALDRFDGVVLSPGPGRPEVAADFGVCRALIERVGVPLLGVCLGHQGLGAAFGARIGPAPVVMHGRTSTLRHVDDPLFDGIPRGIRVVRYHSLMVDRLPPSLRPLAWADDGVLMALRHVERPLWGVQFHPESICTEHGRALLGNFARIVGGAMASDESLHDISPKPSPTHRLHVEAIAGPIDPEAAYAHLFHGERGAFWLDTADGGRHVLGCAGAKGVIARYRVGGRLTLDDGDGMREESVDGFFEWLGATLDATRIAPDASRPFPFAGGLVGYLGYRLGAECGVDGGPPDRHPDAVLVAAERVVVIDGPRAWLATVDPLAGPSPHARWRDEIRRALASLPPAPPLAPVSDAMPPLTPARSLDRYRRDIAACLDEIRRGETYEVCLTTHLRTPAAIEPFAFHRALRRRNPAPYAALFEPGGLSIVSASPERFLRITADGAVEARPIKGTRARHADPAADAAARDDLARAEKDRAENLMICDLLRNDLGRVCAVGSVHVPALMRVESYATVHQLVSVVRGRLRPGLGAVDCVRAAFPGGSMTGAPKRRTTEIIARLEGTARGVYSGALGWFGFDGAAELAIVIRSAVIDSEGCSIGVGGAIVALSDAEAEVDEMLLKGRALAEAMGARLPER